MPNNYSMRAIDKSYIPLKTRLEEALKHCQVNVEDQTALWPYMPFSLTIGELLRAAIRGEKQ